VKSQTDRLPQYREAFSRSQITHIDDGFGFLGWRIQRHLKKGTTGQRYVYTYATKPLLRMAHC
jgi:RNA-directed DNA polymerase